MEQEKLEITMADVAELLKDNPLGTAQLQAIYYKRKLAESKKQTEEPKEINDK